MTNKLFRTSLDPTERAEVMLRERSRLYRAFYNEAIDTQFEVMVRNLPDREVVLSVEELKYRVYDRRSMNGVYTPRTDRGMLNRAIENAHSYFTRWWYERLFEKNGRIEITPRHLSRKFEFFFCTNTQMSISEKGRCYFPRFGKVRFKNPEGIPLGTYKNVFVSYTAGRWFICMEALENTRVVGSLHGEVKVEINEDGSIKVGDKFFESPLKTKEYRNKRTHYFELLKKIERQEEMSNRFLETKRLLERTFQRAQRIKETFARNVLESILADNPEVIQVSFKSTSRGAQTFRGEPYKEIGTLSFLRTLKRRADEIGALIILSDNISKKIFKD